ncbi:MAG: ribosome-associated translation inhibitor RaiA [Pirellulaceae bacterium]|nr:ribosome-associated translation inhibitor RaiA [Pirellulaceae bacterium]
MQINVSARHGTLSGPDNGVISEKAGKLQRFHDRINAISITVDFQHQDNPWLEINVSAEHAPEFVASATAPTVLAAMDAAMSKVEQQLRKHKEKLTDHKASSIKHIPTKDDTQEE